MAKYTVGIRFHSVPWKSRDKGRTSISYVEKHKPPNNKKGKLTALAFCSSSVGIDKSSTDSSANAGDVAANEAAVATNAVDMKERRDQVASAQRAPHPEGLGAWTTNADATGSTARRVENAFIVEIGKLFSQISDETDEVFL